MQNDDRSVRLEIDDLARETDVSTRTIRYYTTEGLLPRPEERGKVAFYGLDHLLRLRLIRRMTRQGRPLAKIKAELEGLLTVDQVQERLATDLAEEVPPVTASAYIARILGTSSSPQREHAESSGARQPLESHDSEPLRGTAERHKSDAHSLKGETTPGDANLPAETWERLTLAPGVELHVCLPVALETRKRIHELSILARKIFGASRKP